MSNFYYKPCEVIQVLSKFKNPTNTMFVGFFLEYFIFLAEKEGLTKISFL